MLQTSWGFATLPISHKGCNIDIKIKIIDIRYNAVKDKNPNNPVAGYAFFYDNFDKKVLQGEDKKIAFEYARKQCVKNGYLKDLVERNDFMVDYDDFLDYGKQLATEAFDEGMEKGIEKGIEKGRKEGEEKGIEKGRKEGEEKGRKEGEEKGRKEGEEKGKEKGKLEAAVGMLKIGLSKDKISQALDVPLEWLDINLGNL